LLNSFIAMKSKIAFVLCCLMILSCGGKKEVKEDKTEKKDPYEKLKSLNWFIGSWENKSPEGTMTESWMILNDSVYSGSSFYVEGKDTLFSEQIRLEQRGADIFYIPVVKDQNEGKPVMFKLTPQESYPVQGEQAVFENPKHDFPQKVSYLLQGDSLIAWISGKMEGKDHSEKFPMVRVK
jgi:hypothetical protein